MHYGKALRTHNRFKQKKREKSRKEINCGYSLKKQKQKCMNKEDKEQEYCEEIPNQDKPSTEKK